MGLSVGCASPTTDFGFLIRLGFKRQRPNDFYYDYTPLNRSTERSTELTPKSHDEGPS